MLRHLKTRPRRPQEASRTLQDRSKTAPGRPGGGQERPRAVQESPKRGLGAVQEGPKMEKNRVPRGIPSWTLLGPPKSRFWDPKMVDFEAQNDRFLIDFCWFCGWISDRFLDLIGETRSRPREARSETDSLWTELYRQPAYGCFRVAFACFSNS